MSSSAFEIHGTTCDSPKLTKSRITILASLKKVIVDSGQMLRDLAGFYIISIEKAAYTGMFGRGETVADKKCRDCIETGIVETVDTGIPPLGPVARIRASSKVSSARAIRYETKSSLRSFTV
jgi:hypothetical protein